MSKVAGFWEADLRHRINAENFLRKGTPLYPTQLYEKPRIMSLTEEMIDEILKSREEEKR